MKPSSRAFSLNARRALHDRTLQEALAKAGVGFVARRRAAIDALPEFQALHEAGRRIKDHTLAHLDHYLLRFEQVVQDSGGIVHWAETPQEACAVVLEICLSTGAKTVAKGKSMVGEEIAVNDALEGAGFEVVETDLGEYIIQLAHEPPSHIIAPAVHKTRQQIAHLFEELHHQPGLTRPLQTVPEIVDEARKVLRAKFLSADVGITGANFLIAETGSLVLLAGADSPTNLNFLPDDFLCVLPENRIVPRLEDAWSLLRAERGAMPRAVNLVSGPSRTADVEQPIQLGAHGPRRLHVLLLRAGM